MKITKRHLIKLIKEQNEIPDWKVDSHDMDYLEKASKNLNIRLDMSLKKDNEDFEDGLRTIYEKIVKQQKARDDFKVFVKKNGKKI